MAHVPRLYIPERLGPGPITLDAAQARRLTSVMRLREGESFLVFPGDGREWRARLVSVSKAATLAEIEDLTRQEPALPIILEAWLALIRPQLFDLAIEKCTEAGVDIIRPMRTGYLARGESASGQRQDRWERIAIEAAEQSGRLRVPVIEAPTEFSSLLNRPRIPTFIGEQHGRPWSEVAERMPLQGAVAVVIGPEGGFSRDELAAATAHGAVATSFGPNILRAETAAIVAVSLVRSLGR
ncbi:MAG: 16S rRNA (uracil(1498)-N(3))-methyltransferase [Dehalococcoidia bacterium]|nr:16S rRNA (uracil(1498)-N(3))-methyltransferase [Dehalococcoidia bacterium]